MKYNKLDCLNIKPSSLGFGCWQLGGHGWGKVSETEMVKAVHKAIECGINFFDTAPIYGLGHSEEVLGRALGGERENVIIATKVGLVWKTGPVFEKFTDCSPANINNEIEMSLKRLDTDYIDLYQIHYPDSEVPIQDTLSTMEKLKDEGKILGIGCCNFSLEQLKEATRFCKVDSLQIPYNLIDRNAEKELLPYCRKNGICVLVYGPLAKGLLTGKYDIKAKFNINDNRNKDKYFRKELLLQHLNVAERVKMIAKKLNKTPAQIALRWVLENPCEPIAIFGAKNAAQVEENIVSADFELSQVIIEFLNNQRI